MEISEAVREAMRRWVSGVAVVTSRAGEICHGMTVNSFTSISLEPALMSLTLGNNTRTYGLVVQSGFLGLTILSEEQKDISERFAGKVPEEGNRFAGLHTFEMGTGSPFIQGGLAFMDCRVVFSYPMPTSTLFIAEVLEAQHSDSGVPLLYYNRGYPRLPV